MDAKETAVFVNGLIKKQFGLDLKIGDADDINGIYSSSSLSAFMDGDNLPHINEVIDFLLGQNNDDIESLVWGSIADWEEEKQFSGAFKALLNSRKQARESYFRERGNDKTNQTEEFHTKRLLLKPLTFKMRDEMVDVITKEGERYWEHNILALKNAFGNHKVEFGIYTCDGKTLLGEINITQDDSMARFGWATMGSIAYYIFQPYRRCGYATEATSALIDKVFSGEVYKRSNSKRKKYKFVKEPIAYDIVKSYVNPNNIGSYKVCLNAGFKEEGKISIIDEGEERYEYVLSINKSSYKRQ